MNTHRVTLTAFGTTGVLLAASLTMLAIVSALVTFDAWPTRDPGVSPAEIAIQNPKAAKVVPTGRRASASSDAGASGAVGAGSAELASGLRAAGLPAIDGGRDAARDGGGGGEPSNPIVDQVPGDPAPTPRVSDLPPGEGDPGNGGIIGSDGTLVGEVTSTVYEAVPVEVEPPAEVSVDLPTLP